MPFLLTLGAVDHRVRPGVVFRPVPTTPGGPALFDPIQIDGCSLGLDAVERVARGASGPVALTPAARGEVARARTVVERVVAGGTPVYGVTTGFGRLAEKLISPAQRADLQRNLIRSHAAGMGPPLEREAVRVFMPLWANVIVQRRFELPITGSSPTGFLSHTALICGSR